MARKAGESDSGGKRGTTALPSLRFYHTKALRTKTLDVLEGLETAEDATTWRGELAEIVLELTEAGLAYYFVKPVEAAKAGYMAQQTTRFGIAGILRLMGPVARRVLGGMDRGQLLTVSKHLRHLME